jgi:hypothetical protein
MKKNTVPATNSFSGLLRMIICFLIVYSLAGCKSDDKDKPKEPIRNWITLDIRFKVNTTADLRDLTIRTIEKLLIDSFTMSTFPMDSSYFPIISISKSPSTDTLRYFLNVGPDSNSTKIQSFPPHDQVPTNRPPCECANGCKVCIIIKGNFENPPPDHPEYKYIASISYATPEIESK